jgi:hypothetical protein
MTSANALYIRAIRGPILLIALGVLLAAQRFTDYGITRTWPVLLILLGLMKLAERLALRAENVTPAPPGGSES